MTDPGLPLDVDLDLDVVVRSTGQPAALVAAVAGLVAQTVSGFRLLLETGPGDGAADAHPAVRGALRVLEHRGNRVVVDPDLLRSCTAGRVLRLDDDVLLAPTALADLLRAGATAPGGVVEVAVHGLVRGPLSRCVLTSRTALPAATGAVPSPS